MKKKRMIVIIAAILVGIVLGLIFYVNAMKQDLKYGLSLDVEDVSSNGATVYLRQDDKKKEKTLTAGNTYQLQKLTVIGWKDVPISRFQSSVGKAGESEDYYKKWNLEWDDLKLGIYRISKNVNVSGNERTLSAPFIVWRWWNSIGAVLMSIGIVVAAILSIGLWKRVKRRKRFVIVMASCVCALGLLIGSANGIFEYFYYYKVAIAYEDVGITLMSAKKEELEVYKKSGICFSPALEEKTLSVRRMLSDESGKLLQIKEVNIPLSDSEKVETTDEQIAAVREIFASNYLELYTRLWFQYDAIITADGEEKCMINLEDGILLRTGGLSRAHSCIYLTDEEVEVFEAILENK